jgi:hypothetical protein
LFLVQGKWLEVWVWIFVNFVKMYCHRCRLCSMLLFLVIVVARYR